MEIKINDLPELLTELIKKSGKTKKEIQDAVGLSNSTLSRLCNRHHGMQKSTAKLLNDYFEVPYFTSYQIKNGTCVHSDVIVPNNKGNKYAPGCNVMNLFNRNIFMVTDIKFNKAKQEWLYKYNSEWIEEQYLKEIVLKEPSLKDMENLNNLDKIIDKVLLEKEPIDIPNGNDIKLIKEEKEMKIAPKPLFEIPQFEVTPEEAIKDSIEKIDDKDSIKNILKDVVVRLINLL